MTADIASPGRAVRHAVGQRIGYDVVHTTAGVTLGAEFPVRRYGLLGVGAGLRAGLLQGDSAWVRGPELVGMGGVRVPLSPRVELQILGRIGLAVFLSEERLVVYRGAFGLHSGVDMGLAVQASPRASFLFRAGYMRFDFFETSNDTRISLQQLRIQVGIQVRLGANPPERHP